MENYCDSQGLMPIATAKDIIAKAITRVQETELCCINMALDRVLSQDVYSPINVPSYDNSAMDGFAFRHCDINPKGWFTVIGKSFAGQPFTGSLGKSECVRIMTGAQIPKGADTVIMQEAAQTTDNLMQITSKVELGANIRKAGSDIEHQSCVLSKGHKCGPVDIGLLASLGVAEVEVARQLNVAVFSTGDELLLPKQTMRPACIYDSNRPMILAMLKRLGINTIDMGIVKDDKKSIQKAFEHANAIADCVITSGGVSVGEADYTKEVLNEYGEIGFWKLAIKPGKPLAFGRLPNSYFFGLPGNPVSAALTFDKIVVDALLMMAGSKPKEAFLVPSFANNAFKKRPGRTDYQRVHSFIDDHGELKVSNTYTQSSGVLSCFSKSNAYAVIEQSKGNVEKGEKIIIEPYSAIIR